ncbi:MAG: isocitrate/isopropylmalate dehydrogenase family protein [Chloroflexota bacterium]|nr:isocitrate/isopropylmalate dehydrogenase family protein [Chloroflexota bacterium]
MGRKIALVPGDGIGPEVVAAAREVVDATGTAVEWMQTEAGERVYEKYGVTVPEETLAVVRACGVALKGPMANPVGTGYSSPNIALRLGLGMYVNVRVAQAFEGARTHFPRMSVAVVREVTEDIYTGQQQRIGPDAAIGIKHVTRAATQRAARFAFDWARRSGRHKVTVVHKASTLKIVDGLFLEAAQQVAAGYPDIESDEMQIDAVAMQLAREPRQFDVLFAGFQHGDILSDLCCGLAGGLGLGAGGSFGDACALFEAAHGSAPKYAGQDKVNPSALILSAALMLDHLGERDGAARIREAAAHVIREGKHVTYDLGGSAGTREMAAAICRHVASN